MFQILAITSISDTEPYLFLSEDIDNINKAKKLLNHLRSSGIYHVCYMKEVDDETGEKKIIVDECTKFTCYELNAIDKNNCIEHTVNICCGNEIVHTLIIEETFSTLTFYFGTNALNTENDNLHLIKTVLYEDSNINNIKTFIIQLGKMMVIQPRLSDKIVRNLIDKLNYDITYGIQENQ